jgi:methionine-rich copper-binding protein CopC
MRCLLIVTSLLWSIAASAHAHLDRASPAAGATVQTAPTEVVIWFTRDIEAAYSRIEVRDTAGRAMHNGATNRDAGDRTKMSVPLKPLLPGTYTVHWRVLSIDTHKTEGSFTFSVK